MMRIRQDQIEQAAQAGAISAQLAEKQVAEVGDKFRFLDHELSGIKPTSTNAALAEVMTSGDFTYAIQEFVQRKALPGYKALGFAFEPLVKMDTLPNYLAVNRYQDRGSLDDLEFVGEKSQARAGKRDDAVKRSYSVFRWEKQYDFSHEALVNDDMGYFEDQAMKMGISARRTLEKFVSRFYTNGTTIARLVANGALYSQNGRLTSARISEARMAFGQRVDADNEPIQADLAFIVYHRGLADTVLQIQNSELVPELATNAANVVRNAFLAIKDPYIAGAAPNLPWYAFTAHQAANIIPFVLARQQGRPGPLILRKRSDIESVTSMLGTGTPVSPIMGDFHSGNIALMVSDVFGTYIDGTLGNLFDERGAYYSAGTAM